MKWLNMINGHIAWKERLLAYLDGTSQEKLDPVHIKKDDMCELGKWINGDGKAHIHIPYYHWVKSNHTLFHEYAAQIVELHDAGNGDDARRLLNGQYAKLSHQLKQQLTRLANEAIKAE